MSEFVIEYELEKVTSNTTKEYLKEVISSYNSGNYRSTIVVLYSVVVFDLLEKVKILSEIYHDDKAMKILSTMKEMEINNDSYSNREKFLLNEIKNKTLLLNDIEYGRLQNLKQNRDWCAHPVHNQDYKLINPTKEEARALIRNSFEIVFQKEALLSRKVLKDILETSKDYYNRMKLDGFENSINDRFYSKINQATKDQIFKSLWQIVFVLDNEQCIKTRESSYYALLFLINLNPTYYYEIVKKDSIEYSNIKFPEDELKFESHHASIKNSPLEALVYMLSEHPKFYYNMTETAMEIIKAIIQENITYLTISYYLSESIEQHLSKLIEKKSSLNSDTSGYYDTALYDIFAFDDLIFLYNKSIELGADDIVKKFIIDYFIGSKSYANTDDIWNSIKSILYIFTLDEFKQLLEGMNQNNQIYGGRNISSIMIDIKGYYRNNIHEDLDLTNYPNLN